MDTGAIVIILIGIVALAVLSFAKKIVGAILTAVALVAALGIYVLAVPASPLSMFCTEQLAHHVIIDIDNKYEKGQVIWQFSSAEQLLQSVEDKMQNNEPELGIPAELNDKAKEYILSYISAITSSGEIKQYSLQFKDASMLIEKSDTALVVVLTKE